MYKYIKFFAIFSLLLFFFSNEIKAEEMLTWNDCVKEATKNHPNLISASRKLKQSKADKAITVSTMLPHVSADASDKKMETDVKKEYEASSYSLTGKQLLFDGFKTANDVKAASKTTDALQYNYQVTSSNSVSLAQRQLTKELGRRKFMPVKANGDFEITEINRKKPNFEYLADNTIFLKELIARKEAAQFGLKSAKVISKNNFPVFSII